VAIYPKKHRPLESNLQFPNPDTFDLLNSNPFCPNQDSLQGTQSNSLDDQVSNDPIAVHPLTTPWKYWIVNNDNVLPLTPSSKSHKPFLLQHLRKEVALDFKHSHAPWRLPNHWTLVRRKEAVWQKE
jgi:hypothetical protein